MTDKSTLWKNARRMRALADVYAEHDDTAIRRTASLDEGEVAPEERSFDTSTGIAGPRHVGMRRYAAIDKHEPMDQWPVINPLLLDGLTASE